MGTMGTHVDMLLTGLEAGVHLLQGLQRMHLIVERTLQEPQLLRKRTPHVLGHVRDLEYRGPRPGGYGLCAETDSPC